MFFRASCKALGHRTYQDISNVDCAYFVHFAWLLFVSKRFLRLFQQIESPWLGMSQVILYWATFSGRLQGTGLKRLLNGPVSCRMNTQNVMWGANLDDMWLQDADVRFHCTLIRDLISQWASQSINQSITHWTPPFFLLILCSFSPSFQITTSFWFVKNWWFFLCFSHVHNKTRWWLQIRFIFTQYMVKWSNLTCAYFSNGLKLNHQLEKHLPLISFVIKVMTNVSSS